MKAWELITMYEVSTTGAIPRGCTPAKESVGGVWVSIKATVMDETQSIQEYFSKMTPKKRAAERMPETAADMEGKSGRGNAMALGSWGQTERSIINLLYQIL